MILVEINQNDPSHSLHLLIMITKGSIFFELFSMIDLGMRALSNQILLFRVVEKLLLSLQALDQLLQRVLRIDLLELRFSHHFFERRPSNHDNPQL